MSQPIQRPIVITGLGVFCPAGTNTADLWRAVLDGTSAARWICSGNDRIAACPAPAVDLSDPGFRLVRRMDRSAQMALHAARQAVAQAGATPGACCPERTGIVVGTSRGPVGEWENAFAQLRRGRMLPRSAVNCSLASLSGVLSMTLEARGPCGTVSAACASSAQAIAWAADQIRSGAADIMVAGGTEAALHPAVLGQLKAARVLGFHRDVTRTCRPFARDRNGTILGEGAGFIVLESAESAAARKAPVLAVLAGWAAGSQAHGRSGMTEGGGLARIMELALARGGLSADAVGYVNLHGTGTVLNDREEAVAMRKVFPSGVPCSSTKPITGHCLGAGSVLEGIITILALREAVLPPSCGCRPVDPQCELDLVKQRPRPAAVNAVMSNSAGFWGNTASLVFTRVVHAGERGRRTTTGTPSPRGVRSTAGSR